MELFLGWIIFSFVVGFIGSGRKIGFWGAFFISLLLSPLIGLIITLISKSKENEAYEAQILNAQRSQQEALTKLSEEKTGLYANSIADELEKLKKLRDENSITEEEFQILRNKAINS